MVNSICTALHSTAFFLLIENRFIEITVRLHEISREMIIVTGSVDEYNFDPKLEDFVINDS